MKGKRHTTEQKIRILREAAGGKSIVEVSREHNISEVTFHRWKKQFGQLDVNEAKRLKESERENAELKKMLAEDELKDCAVLVMANKQDLSGAFSPNEITEKLGMSQLKGRQWLVQGTSATTGQGLKEGLDWMASVLLKKK